MLRNSIFLSTATFSSLVIVFSSKAASLPSYFSFFPLHDCWLRRNKFIRAQQPIQSTEDQQNDVALFYRIQTQTDRIQSDVVSQYIIFLYLNASLIVSKNVPSYVSIGSLFVPSASTAFLLYTWLQIPHFIYPLIIKSILLGK